MDGQPRTDKAGYTLRPYGTEASYKASNKQ